MEIEKFIEEKEYNPYEERKHKSSFFKNYLYLVKGSLGIGIFSIAKSFRDGGLIFSTIMMIVVGILCTHCLHLLVNASQIMCKKCKIKCLDYSETAENVFLYGPKKFRKFNCIFKYFVDLVILLTYISSISIYLSLISLNLNDTLTNYIQNFKGLYYIELLIITILLILICQIKSFKNLYYFSIISNSFVIKTVCFLLYYYCNEISLNSFIEKKLFMENYYLFPSFLSIIIYSIEGVGTVLASENNMSNNKFLNKFGVLNLSMFTIIFVFWLIGFLGYFTFGENTKDIILNNFNPSNFSTKYLKICIAIFLFSGFPLQFYIIINILEKYYIPLIDYKKNFKLLNIKIRSFIVLLITIFSLVISNKIGQFIDIVGASLFSILGIVIPCILNIIIYWNNWGRYKYSLIKDLCLIILTFILIITVILFIFLK